MTTIEQTPQKDRHEQDAESLATRIEGLEAAQAALYIISKDDVAGISDEFMASVSPWLKLGDLQGEASKTELINRVMIGKEELVLAKKQLELQRIRAVELSVGPAEGDATAGF